MRRLLRALFNLLTFLSLALCVCSVQAWIRSYSRFDSVIHFRPDRTWTQTWIDHVTQVTFRAGPVYEVDSRRGRVRFVYLWSDGDYFRTEQPAWISYTLQAELQGFHAVPWSKPEHLGFAAERRPVGHVAYNVPPGPQTSSPPRDFYHAIYTPWWFWAVLFGVLPLSRIDCIVKSRKRPVVGLCVKCGYDLRATPDRCPECGTIPSKSI